MSSAHGFMTFFWLLLLLLLLLLPPATRLSPMPLPLLKLPALLLPMPGDALSPGLSLLLLLLLLLPKGRMLLSMDTLAPVLDLVLLLLLALVVLVGARLACGSLISLLLLPVLEPGEPGTAPGKAMPLPLEVRIGAVEDVAGGLPEWPAIVVVPLLKAAVAAAEALAGWLPLLLVLLLLLPLMLLALRVLDRSTKERHQKRTIHPEGGVTPQPASACNSVASSSAV